MKLLLYDLFVLCFETGAWLLSPFNNKARLWLKGRVNWHSRLQKQIEKTGLHKNDAPVVWMHAASLGEFEQGRPIIEALREKFPNIKIIISFFSSSGYEIARKYTGADLICYLPTDTPANAKSFAEMIKPTLVIWVKYEYWYHHLKALYHRKIPVFLVSSIFREHQVFFKWYGSFHRKMLRYFNHFFVQNESSALLLSKLLAKETDGIAANVSVSGDTRFDRVIAIAENWIPVPPVEQWLAGAEKILVAGSTWPQDEDQLVHFIKENKDVKLILAPHQVEPDLLKDTMALFGGAMLFSDLLSNTPPGMQGNVLIINNIGLLSRIYRYATVCYVGGGFSGGGIHNVLEASVYGKPVVHGPEYERYQEAADLIEAGGSFAVENALELESKLSELFSNEQLYKQAAMAAKLFVYRQKGSTNKIIDFIQAKRLLTSI